MSECPWGPPAVPGDSVPCPRARRVDQISRATRACVRWPVVSSSSPGRLRPVNEGMRCLPVVDQCSRATHDRVRGPALSSSCPGRLALVSEVPLCRPAVREIRAQVLVPMGSTDVTDDSCPGPRDRGFDPLCWTSRAWVRVLAVSTSCPGRLAPWSEAVRVRPEVPGDSGLGPSTRSVDQLYWVTRARVRSPTVSIFFPGHIGQLSKARSVGQMSLATSPRVRGAAGSTSCPG